MYCRTAYTVCAITEALNAFGAHYRCDLSAEITPAKILGPDVKPRDRLVPSYEVGASRPTIEEVRFAGDSSLEGDGFEPSVPGTKQPVFVAEGELRGPNGGSQKGIVSYAVPMVRIHLPPGKSLRTIGS